MSRDSVTTMVNPAETIAPMIVDLPSPPVPMRQAMGAFMKQHGANVDPGVFLDRLTNEDRRNDWEMKVMLIVIVDPPPAAPAPQ